MERRWIIALPVLLLLVAGLFVFWRIFSTELIEQEASAPVDRIGEEWAPSVEVLAALPEGDQQVYLERSIRYLLSEILSDQSEVSVSRHLALLRRSLFGVPGHVASAAIAAVLADRELDAQTGMGFKVGDKGRLSQPPSLRVALLDWWGQIDSTAAAEMAEQIFQDFTNPDEYAISLRNYAWAHPRAAHHSYLSERTLGLITNPEWMQKPTAGLLEAFDVFVYARAVEAGDVLIDLAADEGGTGRAAAYAAFLSLDRLFQQQPKELFAVLDQGGRLGGTTGAMVAQIVARSDVRQPEVRRKLERYLLSPERTPTELEAFAQVFPNRNYMLSDNLLTEMEVPDGRELQARDVAAYGWVHERVQDPRFESIRAELETIQSRLDNFLYP